MKKIGGVMLLFGLSILLTGCWNNGGNDGGNVGGAVLEGPGMVNGIHYTVDTQIRGDNVGEDIFIYDNEGNLVFSLENDEPQYLVDLFDNYLVIDSGTSASQRNMIVYDIEAKNKIFETDYYPGEEGLVMGKGNIEYYKKIDERDFSSLPECENEYDNGYVEKYGYDIGSDMDADLGDIMCAYFE